MCHKTGIVHVHMYKNYTHEQPLPMNNACNRARHHYRYLGHEDAHTNTHTCTRTRIHTAKHRPDRGACWLRWKILCTSPAAQEQLRTRWGHQATKKLAKQQQQLTNNKTTNCDVIKSTSSERNEKSYHKVCITDKQWERISLGSDMDFRRQWTGWAYSNAKNIFIYSTSLRLLLGFLERNNTLFLNEAKSSP